MSNNSFYSALLISQEIPSELADMRKNLVRQDTILKASVANIRTPHKLMVKETYGPSGQPGFNEFKVTVDVEPVTAPTLSPVKRVSRVVSAQMVLRSMLVGVFGWTK